MSFELAAELLDAQREPHQLAGRGTIPPRAWFLRGPIRMRGGVARHFASGRHFHRGIQAEAT